MTAIMEQTDRRAQHMVALAQANRIRLDRAELKRRVRSGETTVGAVVMQPPEEALTMEIGALLGAQHRWGVTRVRRFLSRVPLSETKAIGTMTERQRRAVRDMLEGDPDLQLLPTPEAPPELMEVAWRRGSGRPRFSHLTDDTVRTLCGFDVGAPRVRPAEATEGLCRGCSGIKARRGW